MLTSRLLSCRISDGAVAELHRLASSDLQDPTLGVDVGTTGAMVKRVLQAVAGLMKPPKDAATPPRDAPADASASQPAAAQPGGCTCIYTCLLLIGKLAAHRLCLGPLG